MRWSRPARSLRRTSACVLACVCLLAGCTSTRRRVDGTEAAPTVTTASTIGSTASTATTPEATTSALTTSALTTSAPATSVPANSVPTTVPSDSVAAATATDVDGRSLGRIGTSTLHALTEDESHAAMVVDDAFLVSLTSVDRAVLLRSDAQPTAEELRARFGGLARPWSAAELARLRTIVADADARLRAQHLTLPLPPHILVARHDPSVYDGAPYTRGATVFLGDALQHDDDPAATFIHELVHIMNRLDPARASALFALLGYDSCAVPYASLGPDLRDRTLTNPDAPPFGTTCITLLGDDATPHRYTQVLRVTRPYDAKAQFFTFIEPVLVEVDAAGTKALVLDGTTIVRPLDAVFAKAVGGNGMGEPLDASELLAANVEAIVSRVPRGDTPNTALLDRIHLALA